jgi:predicted transcriptional regulator
MKISLSESLETAIRRRAEAAGFKTPDEYVVAVVLADLDRAGSATGSEVGPELSPETEAKIQAGLDDIDAGRVIVPDEAFWEAMHRRVREPRAGG